MRQSHVAVYDPNSVNPYGTELSGLFDTIGFKVDHWCTTNKSAPGLGIRARAILATGRQPGISRISLMARRFAGPLRTVFTTRLAKPLVVVWIRDPWDALLLLARAALGGITISIYHNPSSVRNREGLAGVLERALVRRSNLCIVHSAWLKSQVDFPVRNIRVAPHPPYAQTTLGRSKKNANATPARPVVALVGALRPDKGSRDLVQIARETNRAWVLRVLGPDKLAPETEQQLAEHGVTVEHPRGGSILSDDDLITGLLSSEVMIAPYRAVTESGSVHMALSLNVPTLAYQSQGLGHILTSNSMADGPGGLGRLLAHFFESPWPTFTSRATNLYDECSIEWKAVLNGDH